MQPQPQRIQPQSEGRRLTRGYFQTPNFIVENAECFSPAEFLFLSILFRRGAGSTVSDATWENWTGRTPRMKDHAILGLRQKGLHVKGEGNTATYSLEETKCHSWLHTHTRHEKAKTAGRSKSVSAKTGDAGSPECREGGCSGCAETQVIPFPATNLEKPVSQEERRAEDQTPAKQERVPGVVLRPPESPPKKFPQSLGAVQTFFPHVEPEFIDKLRARCDRKVKHYTDAQLAQAINKAMKRTQTSEGLFLDTVPGHLAVILSTRSDLTEPEKRELNMGRMVMENPANYTPDAVEQAREILRKYGGG